MPIYSQHIVEDYDQSPEASDERKRFEPQLRKAMIAVRIIVIRAYADIRFTQLSNERPGSTGAMIEDIISTEVHDLLARAKSEPTINLPSTLAHKVELAFISEQQERFHEELRRAKLKRKDRDMSPEVVGVSGAHITAYVDSDPEDCEASINDYIHRRSIQLERRRKERTQREEASMRVQAGGPAEPVQDEKRQVKKQKLADKHIAMLL